MKEGRKQTPGKAYINGLKALFFFSWSEQASRRMYGPLTWIPDFYRLLKYRSNSFSSLTNTSLALLPECGPTILAFSSWSMILPALL